MCFSINGSYATLPTGPISETIFGIESTCKLFCFDYLC